MAMSDLVSKVQGTFVEPYHYNTVGITLTEGYKDLVPIVHLFLNKVELLTDKERVVLIGFIEFLSQPLAVANT